MATTIASQGVVALPASIAPALTAVDGKVTTTSNQIAEHFGKRHDNVMRAIRNIGAEADADFYRLNFEETSNEVPGPNGATRLQPAYRITRDGFTLLAMGFTGREAMHWKLAYIDAFNRMEAELLAHPVRTPANTILQAAGLFQTLMASMSSLGAGQRDKATAANALVRQATGFDFLAAAGNPHLTAVLTEPGRAKPHRQAATMDRLLRYVGNARSYAADQKFAIELRAGLMPYAKLLKLMACTAEDLAPVLSSAVADGSIIKTVSGYTLPCAA